MDRSIQYTHTLWGARTAPTPEERFAFEGLAMQTGQPLSAWLETFSNTRGGGIRGHRIGSVIELRTQLTKFHDRLSADARKLNDDIAAGRAAPQSADTIDRMMQALRATQKAIENASATIELAADSRNARPLGGGSFSGDGFDERSSELDGHPEIRSAADWQRHMIEGRDIGHEAEFEGRLSMADFLRAIAGMRTTDVARRALTIGTDSAGGFTVPTLLMPGVLAALAPASSLLQAGAAIVPVEQDGAKAYNWPAVQTLPTAAWRAEGGALSESDAVFRNVQAVPRSLSFLFKVSRELLADSMGLEPALNLAIGAAFAKELDRAGLRGSGSAPEPRGVLNVSGIQSVTNGAAGTAQATIKWGNLMSATQAILAADAPAPTSAIMSPRSLIGFGNLVDTTGQPLRRPDTIADMRFIATSQIPNNLTVTTSSDCTELYVGDFSVVKFVMRERPSIQLLRELYAATGQIGFACHVRADVVVTYPSALAVCTGIRA